MVPSLDLLDVSQGEIKDTEFTSGVVGGSELTTINILNYLEDPDTHIQKYDTIDTRTVTIELWGNRQQDKKFLTLASNYKFPPLYKFQVKLIDDIEEDDVFRNFIKIMSTSISEPLKYLHLGGGHYSDLYYFRDSLENVLPLVSEQIYLVSFCINGETLLKIFKNAINVKSLVIAD
jgi:hypothetical protein